MLKGLKKFKGFTTVEILIAVGLVAILMVVAIPRLLDSRSAVSSSAAKQQIASVKTSVDSYFAEKDTYAGLDSADLAKNSGVDIVGASVDAAKRTDGKALTVSMFASDSEVVLVASNGETECWGIKLSTTATEGTKYTYKEVTSPGVGCNATAIAALPDGTGPGTWQLFEYPAAS